MEWLEEKHKLLEKYSQVKERLQRAAVAQKKVLVLLLFPVSLYWLQNVSTTTRRFLRARRCLVFRIRVSTPHLFHGKDTVIMHW